MLRKVFSMLFSHQQPANNWGAQDQLQLGMTMQSPVNIFSIIFSEVPRADPLFNEEKGLNNGMYYQVTLKFGNFNV